MRRPFTETYAIPHELPSPSMILTTLSVPTIVVVFLFPIGLLLVLGLLMIPCMLQEGSRPSACIKAIYCYLLQLLGMVLMTIGALPASYGVIGKFATGSEILSAEGYLVLLILFATGGLTYLWHERMAEDIDDASRRVPALLFWYVCKLFGYCLTLSAVLWLILTMLMARDPLPPGWWSSPVILALYGLLLGWCTRTPMQSGFKTKPMIGSAKRKK